MEHYYYLSLFPTEALIASQLTPEQFGFYMANGSRKGSAEKIIFAEIESGFGDYFDWKYCEQKCSEHGNGNPKNSLYLSIYRVLEHIPLTQIGSLYLTTKDGRTLKLDKTEYQPPAKKQDFMIYQELCPVTPMVVSRLNPPNFAKLLTSKKQKIHLPKITFADLKLIDFADPEHTGNIGGLYDRNIHHLLDCIKQVTSDDGKDTKILDRSHVESFSFNIIRNGIFIADEKELLYYHLPTIEEIKQIDYDWGRSALIL